MPATRTSILPDCRPLLADPDDLTLVFQPIADLAAARTAGWSALARFPGTAGPEVWFAAAAELGLAAELEALALTKALAALPLLPDDTFLTVAVSAALLDSGPVQEALADAGDLRRVVVELTGPPPADLPELQRRTTVLRARGARVALHDPGRGIPDLRHMAALRPQLARLDRALLADAGTDPVTTALVEAVAGFAERTGARLLGSGVETAGELAALVGLGVPLAQGWLLGRPVPDLQPLTPESARLVRAQVVRARVPETVASLLRPVRRCEADAPAPGMPPAVVVGPLGEPLALLLADLRTGAACTVPVSLQVAPSADIAGTLHRALARPAARRFDPVVCTDAGGAVLGLLRVDDLASAACSR
ncbi:MAG TPA: EAL domain-containing protein [Geodermatophilus sp.]|nr:EAL domain-containing protein [Geodermatophilus sp.]